MSVSRKIVLTPLQDQAMVPFDNGEEAWMWFSRCQITRHGGARYTQGLAEFPRGCDPDDVYRLVMGLYQKKALVPDHLRVLGSYGYRLTPPNPFDRAEEKDVALWEEALDKLFGELKEKGLAQ